MNAGAGVRIWPPVNGRGAIELSAAARTDGQRA